MSITEAQQPQLPDVPHTPEGLERTARRALLWSIANNLVSRMGTTLMGIVLARILAPDDYGLFAVALVALNTLLSMNELGVSVAIIRWPDDVSRIAPTVQTLSLLSSLVLWTATFLLAPTIASALNAPDATNVLRLLTLSILIDAVTAVPAAVMTREFMQRERMIVDTAGFAISATATIGLAVAGAGPWALVAGALLGNTVNAAFILRYVPRRHRFGFDAAVARELLAFGLPLALASLLVMAMLNVDYVVIGATLDTEELGFYLLAFNLSAWPVNMFSAPARRISLPLFARLHNGETDASAAFVPVCTVLLLVTLPSCLMIGAFAGPLVQLVYGDTWSAASVVLPWLMALALARVLGELVYDFLTALGRTVPNMVLQALWLVALVAALPFAVQEEGIEGVAMAHAAVAAAVVLPGYAVVLRRAGVSLRALVRALLRPLIGGLLATGAGLGMLELVDSDLVLLLGGSAAVGVVYVAVVWPMRSMLRTSALTETA